VLNVKSLTYGPAGMPSLQQRISFSLSPGELLHIVGVNGCGKSFLLRTILGISPWQSGEISLGFASFRYLPQMQNRAAHLPYSLEDILRFESKNFEDVKKFGLLESAQFSLSWNKASGGERQRTLLTRLFLQAGDLLVLDEPFNHLDGKSKEKVRVLIRQSFENNSSAGAILISHDDEPAAWMGAIPIQTLRLEEIGSV